MSVLVLSSTVCSLFFAGTAAAAAVEGNDAILPKVPLVLVFLPAAKPRRSMDHSQVIGGRGGVSASVPNKFKILEIIPD